MIRRSAASTFALVLASGCVGPGTEVLERSREDFTERTELDVRWDATSEEVRDVAREDGLLTIDEAVRIALVSNARLASMLAELDVARADLVAATVPQNPVVSGDLYFPAGGGGRTLELGLAQNVLDLVFLPRRRTVANARLEAAIDDATSAMLDLAAETRTAYRDLQADQELAELYRTALDTAFASYDLSRRLREAGNIVELDLLNDQVLYEELKLSLTNARGAVLQGRENLAVLLGIDGPAFEGLELAPRLPETTPLGVDAESAERRTLEASLDLDARRHHLEALGTEIGLSRLEEMLSAGELGIVSERDGDGAWALGPTASVSLPLWNTGQAAALRARAEFRRAFEEFTDEARRLRRHARSLVVAAGVSGENARYQRDVVLPLRERITQATQRRFNAMQIGTFQVLTAKRDQIAAARDYVESRRTHWRARIELEALLLGRDPAGGYGIAPIALSAGGTTRASTSGGAH